MPDTDGFEVTALELIGDRAYVLVAGFIFAVDISDPASLGEPAAAGGQWADLGAPGAGWLAYTFGQNAPSFLGDHSSLASPVVLRAPEESRWWHPGIVVGDTLLRVMLQEESIAGMSITINIDDDDADGLEPPWPPQPPPATTASSRLSSTSRETWA